MKALYKLFLLIMGCILITSVSSCLGSDDYEPISNDDYKAYLSLMVGSYTKSEIYYMNDSSQIDTLSNMVAVVSSDSLITFRNVPSTIISKCISEHDSLKKAIEAVPTKDVTIGFVLSSVQSPYIYFNVYPISISYPNLEYEGKTHDVEINLYTYYMGVYEPNAYKIDYEVFMTSVSVDGDRVETFYDDTSDVVQLRRASLSFHASRY